ncbi:isoamyl acetate-hydrolyzing esterase [Coemansia spiralis]|nr:isoamyl acetate-hydrolyzing esterase [Coemansia spiralis]
MRIIALLLFVAVARAVPFAKRAIGKPQGQSVGQLAPFPLYDVILAFGDFITESDNDTGYGGWVTNLANSFGHRMDVLNRGFSGLNTTAALGVVDRVFPVTQPLAQAGLLAGTLGSTPMDRRNGEFPGGTSGAMELCVLFFGTNDAVVSLSPQHVELDEYKQNMRQMVLLLQDPNSQYFSPRTRTIIVTPPPVNDAMADETTKSNPNFKYFRSKATKTYADAAIAVAQDFCLPYVDLHTEIVTLAAQAKASPDYKGKFSGYDAYLADGVHPNTAGNKLLYSLVMSTVNSTWPSFVQPISLPSPAN